MPTLEWIGKDKVVNHDKEVPFYLLEPKYSFDRDGQHDPTDDGNMIIHGDNLTALKSLLPKYGGKIDCICIDPPYNTGEEKWVYNDNVNDPQIKKWINTVVGKEGEDLSRHDKWLCMMFPRLRLLYELLSTHGVIFIFVGDDEHEHLKAICDEVFGPKNFIACVIWEKKYGIQNDATFFSTSHDYILVYAKNKEQYQQNLLPRTSIQDSRYINYDNDPRGAWKSADFTVPHISEDRIFPITLPSGRVVYPANGRSWGASAEDIQRLIEDNRLWFGVHGNSIPSKKLFLSEVKQGITPTTLWKCDVVGHTDEALKEIKDFFDGSQKFETPKPCRLIERILQLATQSNSVILDSFAGSGTTAHAVLDMNNRDGGNRKFILVEMMDYADTITAERVKKVITGYTVDKKELIFDETITAANLQDGAAIKERAKECRRNARAEYDRVSMPKMVENHLQIIGTKVAANQVQGTGGSFNFYEIGLPLFDVDGNLNKDVPTDKIREYIWYTETKTAMPDNDDVNIDFLGTYKGTGYYFVYDRENVTTLDKRYLRKLKKDLDGYVIYADICTVSDKDLADRNVKFKKIPRDIKRL